MFDKKKSVLMLIVFLTCSQLFAVGVRADALIEDRTQDLYSVSFLQFYTYVGTYFEDDPPDSQVEYDAMKDDLIEMGVPETGPAYADIETIRFNQGATNTTLTISTRDDIDMDQHLFLIMGWGEYEGEDFFFQIGGFLGETRYSYNNVSTGGEISGSNAKLRYPTNDFNYQDGDALNLMTLTIKDAADFEDESDLTSAKVYFDLYAANDPNENSYEGTDTVTNAATTFSNWIFGNFMTGSGAFIFMVAILLAIVKILAQRRNKIVKTVGLMLGILPMYLIMFYAFEIELSMTNYINIANVFTFLALIGFYAFTVMKTLNWREGDNLWMMYVALGITIVTQVLSFAVLPMISSVVLTICIIAGLSISNYYAKKRGK